MRRPRGRAAMHNAMQNRGGDGFDRRSGQERGDDRARPARILIIIPSLDIGGAEMDLVRQLPRLDRDRFDITVLTLFRPGVLAARLIESGIAVVDINGISVDRIGVAEPPRDIPELGSIGASLKRRLSFIRTLLRRPRDVCWICRRAFAVARFIRNADVDVVHTVLPNAYVVGSLANLLAGRRPLVMSRLSLNFYHLTLWPYLIIEPYLLHRLVDITIGNAHAVLRDLRAEGVPEDKLRLVYNGVEDAVMVDRDEARLQLGIASTALVLSAVGNLHVYKGHADLLQSLSLISARLPESWVLIVAGRDVQGSLENLRRRAHDLGLSRNVRFVGERNDVPVILSAADIHISASHHEGFPNNILEAMSAGLPVVATAVGGVPEQIIDGETGILVPARDHAALAAAIEALVADVDARQAMGRAGREHVTRTFRIERSVAALSKIYLAAATKGVRDRLQVERSASMSRTNFA
jgi:glycosyltransferase involved in cell wall biosynthesis